MSVPIFNRPIGQGFRAVRVAGIVVDTIDEIVHGAVLGKRGIAAQIESWCESGFVDQLFCTRAMRSALA